MSAELQLDNRCHHTSADGRRCRMLRREGDPSLCPEHRRQQLQPETNPATVAVELLGSIEDFQSATAINQALGRLFALLAGNRIGRPVPAISTGAGDLHIGHKNCEEPGLTWARKLLYSWIARGQAGKSGVINLSSRVPNRKLRDPRLGRSEVGYGYRIESSRASRESAHSCGGLTRRSMPGFLFSAPIRSGGLRRARSKRSLTTE